MSKNQEFDPSLIPENRPLSGEERALIDWLIEHGTGDTGRLQSQIPRARVIGRCHCGCPTVDIAIEGMQHGVAEKSEIIADFVGHTPEAFRVGVLLWVTAGDLSGLEVYNLCEKDGPFSLPTIGTLKAWEHLSK